MRIEELVADLRREMADEARDAIELSSWELDGEEFDVSELEDGDDMWDFEEVEEQMTDVDADLRFW
jgi:hypothetical protein